MTGDMWEHTAIFITWDEWGGFYDSVMPPVLDDFGLGFRVPLLTISPYTRRGLIDSELGEFSTPLRFISDNWGLDPLTDRIAEHAQHGAPVRLLEAPSTADAVDRSSEDVRRTVRIHPEDYPGWPPGTTPDDYIPRLVRLRPGRASRRPRSATR